MDKSNSVHNPIVQGFKPTKDEGGVVVDKTTSSWQSHVSYCNTTGYAVRRKSG